MRRGFLVIGNKAKTKPFNLNDLPGAGRIDILCRCVSQALFLSHSIRRDAEIYLLLLGSPNPPKAIKFKGSELRKTWPDERNIAGHINKALSFEVGEKWFKSEPGILVTKKGLEKLLSELSENYEIYYMREDGLEIGSIVSRMENPLFVLGDHIGVKKEDEEIILSFAKNIVSVSKISLMAEQCITIANYELDRVQSQERGKFLNSTSFGIIL
ncbi:tRNA (pseudouridine(54)-N(1))-methyltransferase TrmY [Candidatus Bathyarchaeota archaeon]|nr:tRNA (pseudouridine(54)-N(1))-methyltransferase TrmY [Candidatus Bathyarchaeota archaeon]